MSSALLPSWLLVSTADLTSSWSCPAQDASWLLPTALKNQGQMLQAGTQPSSLLPQDMPACFPLPINIYLVFWLHSSRFLNALSLRSQNAIHLNSGLPSLIPTHLPGPGFLWLPHPESCTLPHPNPRHEPPGHSAQRTPRHGYVCVPSPSWPPCMISRAEPSTMPHPHPPSRGPAVREGCSYPQGTDTEETEALEAGHTSSP